MTIVAAVGRGLLQDFTWIIGDKAFRGGQLYSRHQAASGIIKGLALNNLKEMSVAAEPTNAGEELGGKTDLCLIQIRLAMPSLEKISLGCQGDSP
jgi:hypothetical protein